MYRRITQQFGFDPRKASDHIPGSSRASAHVTARDTAGRRSSCTTGRGAAPAGPAGELVEAEQKPDPDFEVIITGVYFL